MTTAAATAPTQPQHLADYRENGWTIVRGLVPAARAAEMRDHYMRLRAEGPKPGDMVADKVLPGDPLVAFPRMINMHGWDPATATWASDPAVVAAASSLIGQRALLNQTMLYFKPPGARGQAAHQDQQYITKDPLIGAWCALDRADRANGGMVVVSGSHRLGVQPVRPTTAADDSFTGGATVMPAGAREMGVDLDPGDVLFFAGATIHGSHRNTTSDRFRRAFICHYVGDRAVDFAPEAGTNMRHLAP